MEDVYTRPKEIILTRDFRDIICSARSFNLRRDKQGFGREQAIDDRDWVTRVFAGRARSLAQAWEERNDTALHVRYEDLVSSTERELVRIFDYLDVESYPSLLNQISEAVKRSEKSAGHKTSASPSQSISRWKTDLPEALLLHCNESMGRELGLFGYA